MTVLACPACDVADLQRTGGDETPAYRCRSCEARVEEDAAVERPARAHRAGNVGGQARLQALLAAGDDEDDAEDDSLRCDGGRPASGRRAGERVDIDVEDAALARLLDAYGPGHVCAGHQGQHKRVHFDADCKGLGNARRLREIEHPGEAPLRAGVCRRCDPRESESA
jgi:hypothetical protein